MVDVRPDDRIEPDDAEAFAATARACRIAGWAFRRVGAIDPVLLANVKWLAGYRHPRNHREPVATPQLIVVRLLRLLSSRVVVVVAGQGWVSFWW